MSSSVLNAFNSIFEENEKLLRRQQKKDKLGAIEKNDLHLAVVVLLVDLASTDSNFDSREFLTICVGMQRLFGISQPQVTKLISQANQIIASMRGVDRFATLLKEQVDEETRKQIMEIIHNVIAADGHEDDFEIYLKHKFKFLLGLEEGAKG
ncbi:MAG: hypothetical protein RL417_1700 [Pseudomonadota bacterium]|jgi:uncharacterized tellurite resistance protein B-like protein